MAGMTPGMADGDTLTTVADGDLAGTHGLAGALASVGDGAVAGATLTTAMDGVILIMAGATQRITILMEMDTITTEAIITDLMLQDQAIPIRADEAT